MARTDRAYRKMMRRKTMLCAEKDYRDILLAGLSGAGPEKNGHLPHTAYAGAVYRTSRLDPGGGSR